MSEWMHIAELPCQSDVYCTNVFVAKWSHVRLDRIIHVVREGQTRRAPIERVADFLTGYFVPVVTLLAIVTWVVWLSLGVTGALPDDYLDIAIGGWRKEPFNYILCTES